VAVTTTKESHARIAFAWLWRKVSHRCFGSGSRPGFLCRYLPTVRGEIRIPSFNLNSFAMRSCPQIGLSAAIFRIKFLMSFGTHCLPLGFDFYRQKSRNPLRCQRTNVSGLTTTSALRQSNRRLRCAINQRVESSARWGRIFRS
jgi:hypothetical protein